MATVYDTPINLDIVRPFNRSYRKVNKPTRRRQRSIINNVSLQKRKRLANDMSQWQAHQIQLWHTMNEEMLEQEKRLKKLSVPIDKT